MSGRPTGFNYKTVSWLTLPTLAVITQGHWFGSFSSLLCLSLSCTYWYQCVKGFCLKSVSFLIWRRESILVFLPCPHLTFSVSFCIVFAESGFLSHLILSFKLCQCQALAVLLLYSILFILAFLNYKVLFCAL